MTQEQKQLVKNAALKFHAGLLGYENMGFIAGAEFMDQLLAAPSKDEPGMRDTGNSRAIGLLEGIEQGIKMVGKEMNVPGVLSIINEVIEILKWESTKQPARIWQLCPKCNGQGRVCKPPYLAAEITEWSSTAVDYQCDVCHGAIIIATPTGDEGAKEDTGK